MDIFLKKDANKLLQEKHVVFIGDSNTRALYKDLLCLKRNSKLIGKHQLKSKMERTVFGDTLITCGPMNNSRLYTEERAASISGTKMSFYFITRVYDSYVEDILEQIRSKPKKPDVFVINSCLWDITRWGPRGVETFKSNLVKLMDKLKQYFSNCLIIWITTPPVAQEMKGGFLVKELEFMKYSLRFHVVEANHYARKIVSKYGFDILDSHYHLKMQLKRRALDGIHWMPDAVRYVTNLLLAHISLAWGVPLPHRYKTKNEQNLQTIPNDGETEEASSENDDKQIKKIKVESEVPSTSGGYLQNSFDETSLHHNFDSTKKHKRLETIKINCSSSAKKRKRSRNRNRKKKVVEKSTSDEIDLSCTSLYFDFADDPDDDDESHLDNQSSKEITFHNRKLKSAVVVPLNGKKSC